MSFVREEICCNQRFLNQSLHYSFCRISYVQCIICNLSILCFLFHFGHLDILVQHIMHYLGVCCILLIEECATLILVLYIIYTSQSSFCLVHFMISTFGYLNFIWFNVNTSLQCLIILSYFAHLPKLYYAFYHHMLCLISGSFCLVLLILSGLSYKLYLRGEI